MSFLYGNASAVSNSRSVSRNMCGFLRLLNRKAASSR